MRADDGGLVGGIFRNLLELNSFSFRWGARLEWEKSHSTRYYRGSGQGPDVWPSSDCTWIPSHTALRRVLSKYSYILVASQVHPCRHPGSS